MWRSQHLSRLSGVWAGRLFIYLIFSPFRVFAAFRGHWGGTLVAFTVLVVFTGHWGWTLMALFSVCSVYEGCRLVFLFIYLFFVWRGAACSVHGALGWDSCGVYSVSSFLLGIGVGRLWRLSTFVAFMRHAGWSVYFIYLFIYCVAWRGVACSIYGACGWSPCGVHSVCSVNEAFGLVAFCGI